MRSLVDEPLLHQERPEAPALTPDFAELYQEHSHAIYYLALRLLGDPQKAEDATHDVFLKAFRKLDEFRGDATVRTWLYRIAINHCRNLQSSWHQRHVATGADEVLLKTPPRLGIRRCEFWKSRNWAGASRTRWTPCRMNTVSCYCSSPTRN